MNPAGFWAVAAVDFCILAEIAWFALHAIGVVGNQPVTIPRFG